MKDIAKQIIESTLERLDKLEEFTLEHAPDLCKELIAERETRLKTDMLESIVIGGACLIATGFLIYLLVFAKLPYDYRVAVQAISALVLFFSLSGAVTAMVSLLSTIGDLRVLKAAPKVFVLRELRKFLR